MVRHRVVVEYALENLDPERFQQLAQALLVRERSDVQCLPVAQPDGGRDALEYTTQGPKRGFVVFQVKFVRRPDSLSDPHHWLERVLSEELPKVQHLTERGAQGYYLITNVRGSAHPTTGLIDRASAILAQLPVPGLMWWRDDLNRRLDSNWDVKWVYPDIMTGPDLLRLLYEGSALEERQRRESAIRAYVAEQYTQDSEIRFKQIDLKNDLFAFYVDVPANLPLSNRPMPHTARAAATLVRRLSGRPRKRKDEAFDEFDVDAYSYSGQPATGAAALLLDRQGQQVLQRVVLEGAPGQGKSTLAQFLCQFHRARLIGRSHDLVDLPFAESTLPVRLPFRVDLRDLALWVSRGNPFGGTDFPADLMPTLEGFIVEAIRVHSGGARFDVSDLHAVARVSSLVLVLDGLDEVADPHLRGDVVREVEIGVERLGEIAASLQVVITSRPAVFSNSPGFSPTRFVHLSLVDLRGRQISEYARKWIDAKALSATDGRELTSILRQRLAEPHFRDLSRNPMQLAILLSLIHTRGASLPDKRTTLYGAYMDLFLNREAEKSEIVRRNRDLLVQIHEYLGWLLHAEAETASTRGSITETRLQEVIRNYLEVEGYPTSLADDLFVGIKDRVVALVSRVQGTFEFEVQPLREYFAARFLFDTAPDSPPGNERAGTRPDRFDALARDFYWLNVTRFFAGCYSKGELPSLVDRLEELLSERDFSDTSHPRLLASMLLADYVFAQHPKSVGQVVELMVEKDGLRLLLGSDSPLESLSLPRGSGREQLLARCFEELSKPQSSDYSTRLGHVVRLNGDDEARMEWQSRTEAQRADDRMGWLRHGVSTGFLEQAREEWLASLLATDFSEDAAIALMRANHWRFCEETEDRSRVSIDAVLRKGELRVPHGAHCRLGSLATCMSPFTYFWAFEQQSPIGSLSAAWRRFDPPITLGPFDDDELVATSPQLSRADSFVAVLRDRAELELSVWASTLSPWRDVIESGRSMWGNRSGFIPLAAAAAGIRAPSETAKTSSDLFDPTRPLVDRARYARLRAGSPWWWTRTLKEVDERLNGLLALTVLAMWGSQNTLSEVCGLASQLVESLSDDEYREYVELVQAGHWCISGAGRAGSHAKVDPRALPTNMSPRLLAALRARLPYKRALPLVQSQLMKVKPVESSIVTFVLDTLYEGCARGDVEWKSLVGYAKKAYTDRADSEEWFWGFPWLRQRLISPIPLPVARSIVRDPSSFPLEVLRLAEASCRVAVAEKIVPVASIATRDSWFSE